MQLVEKHIIKDGSCLYKEIDNLAFLSKNLYNKANYIIRQEYIFNCENYISYPELHRQLVKDKDVDYYALPTKISQQTLRVLDQNWKSFKALKKMDQSKLTGTPKMPKYKHKTKGRFVLTYTMQAISKKGLKDGILHLSQTNIKIKTKINTDLISQVRIIPQNKRYCIEVIYELKEEKEIKSNNRVLGIDLGLNNLCTCVSNFSTPFIINGRPLKSINQYYNKEKARLQSLLPKEVYTSKRIANLTNKRNDKINDYLHKSSRAIINYCLANNVDTIVIGKNKQWKTNISLGKKTNQNFVMIPHARLISMIEYKAKLNGISVYVNEESYTSKCSFIDHEHIKKHKKYAGKRVKRGLFLTKEGYRINADCNGAYNIIEKWKRSNKKVIPNFSVRKNGIEGFVVSPRLLEIAV